MIDLAIASDVAHVTLNAPSKLNSLDEQALHDLGRAYDEAEQAGVRALVLRGAKQEPLAVVLVRTNASNLFWKPVTWGINCPRELDVLLFDEAAGSPDRMDCLRLRRNAQAQQWLKRSKPETQAWLERHQQLPVLPYSHLSYRFATEDGGMVELQILADQRLLQPEKGSQWRLQRDWALAVASAARDSLSSLDGELKLPPFPGSV